MAEREVDVRPATGPPALPRKADSPEGTGLGTETDVFTLGGSLRPPWGEAAAPGGQGPRLCFPGRADQSRLDSSQREKAGQALR